MSVVKSRDVVFTEFAAGMTPRLFRTALLMCGDWHLAEDLVQTTLGKLYVAWRKVEASQAPDAYARRALVNTFLSHQRVSRNTEMPTLDLGDQGSTGSDPGMRLELFEALHTLSAADRAVVVLRYWEDRTVAETATEMGLTNGAVRTRASRALGRLRAALSDSSAATS